MILVSSEIQCLHDFPVTRAPTSLPCPCPIQNVRPSSKHVRQVMCFKPIQTVTSTDLNTSGSGCKQNELAVAGFTVRETSRSGVSLFLVNRTWIRTYQDQATPSFRRSAPNKKTLKNTSNAPDHFLLQNLNQSKSIVVHVHPPAQTHQAWHVSVTVNRTICY